MSVYNWYWAGFDDWDDFTLYPAAENATTAPFRQDVPDAVVVAYREAWRRFQAAARTLRDAIGTPVVNPDSEFGPTQVEWQDREGHLWAEARNIDDRARTAEDARMHSDYTANRIISAGDARLEVDVMQTLIRLTVRVAGPPTVPCEVVLPRDKPDRPLPEDFVTMTALFVCGLMPAGVYADGVEELAAPAAQPHDRPSLAEFARLLRAWASQPP